MAAPRATTRARHRRGGAPAAIVGVIALVCAAFLMGGAPSGGAEGNEAPGRPAAFRALAAGDDHTCAIVGNGRVKCWGANASGQLGLGDTANRGDGAGEMGTNLPFVDLGTGRRARAITAGVLHTCALLDNGTVKCWGANASGQLGLGDIVARGDGTGEMGDNLAPVDLGTGRTAVAISAGAFHTCAVLDDATLKCWGRNNFGQLGQGTTANLGDGTSEMGDDLPAIALGTGRTATSVAGGSRFTCALLDDATVKCWGEGGSGQLGQTSTANLGDGASEMGDNLPAINLGTGRTAVSITAAVLGNNGAHACALLDNGQVKCWGANSFGQLGLGDIASRGDLPNEMGDLLPPVDLGAGRTATAITAGGIHTCALLDNASVKCWGVGSNGQLGQGDPNHRGDGAGEMGDNLPAVNLGAGRTATAVTAGNHTCARLDDGALKCWGLNGSGQLGQGDVANRGDGAGEMGDSLASLHLGVVPATAALVDGGASHTCVRLRGGAVKCWGAASVGQLGQGTTTSIGDSSDELGDDLMPVDLGTGRRAGAIAVGDDHTCARLDNGSVKCWGTGANGQLGQGATSNLGDGAGEMGDALPAIPLGTGRTAVGVAAGGFHSCALLDDGTVKCWGLNAQGQLGQGTTTPLGDDPGELGDALPAIALGTGRTATAITAGSLFTCALLDNATVKCWGANTSGQLGQGDNQPRGDGAGELGDALAAVPLGTGRTATAITAGASHACALLDNGAVKCWGANASGQLGQGDTATRGSSANQLGDSLPFVSLGTGRTATAISAAGSQTCALLDNGAVKCWGNGGSGRLGQGTTANLGDGAGELGDDLPAVALGTARSATAIGAGGSHSCAVLDDGMVRCWGNGGSGRLGLGDTTTRGDGAAEMGDRLPTVDLGVGTTSLWGTVTDAVSGQPVAGANVLAMRTDDFSIVGGAVADANGAYEAIVPAGSYFLYLIDGRGRHTAGFHGSPTLVTVNPGSSTAANPTMAPTRGSIAGTVKETGTGVPISNAIVLPINATTGTMGSGATTAGDGTYNLSGLTAGSNWTVAIDPTGTHDIRYFPNASNITLASTIPVTAGATAAADTSLQQQPVPGVAANFQGTLTESGTGAPLAGELVIALRAADYAYMRAAVTDANGAYSLSVPVGSHYLGFLDTTGTRIGEWHSDTSLSNLGAAATAAANGGSPTLVNAALGRGTGGFTGHVTSAGSSGFNAAWVFAVGPTGIAASTVSAADGTFTITGLPPGTYRAVFVDPSGDHAIRWHVGGTDYATATPFSVTAGGTTAGINAVLP